MSSETTIAPIAPMDDAQRSIPPEVIEKVAQFIAVCSSVKTYEIGENLLSVSDPISGPQERLIHAGFLVPTPTLQR